MFLKALSAISKTPDNDKIVMKLLSTFHINGQELLPFGRRACPAAGAGLGARGGWKVAFFPTNPNPRTRRM